MVPSKWMIKMKSDTTLTFSDFFWSRNCQYSKRLNVACKNCIKNCCSEYYAILLNVPTVWLNWQLTFSDWGELIWQSFALVRSVFIAWSAIMAEFHLTQQFFALCPPSWDAHLFHMTSSLTSLMGFLYTKALIGFFLLQSILMLTNCKCLYTHTHARTHTLCV